MEKEGEDNIFSSVSKRELVYRPFTKCCLEKHNLNMLFTMSGEVTKHIMRMS